MYYLIYVSSAAKLMSDEALLVILKQSREWNQSHGITGVLLYQDGNIMQMLEGDKQDVLEIFKKVKYDPRHKGIIKILEGDVPRRVFGEWSMGFFNMDRAGDYPKYDEYIEANISLSAFREDSRKAYEFISVFYSINR